MPWVTTGELRESVILETKKLLSSNAISTFSALRLHPAGSLAIAMYGATIGRLGILGIDATTNQACCLLTRPNHLHVKFTFYWLLAFKQNIIDLYASGGGQPNINQEIIANLKIPAPGVREQIQIARFLDHETARIDALIEEQQRLIELLKEKRQAVISRAVTKGLDATVPMKDSGVEWLGKVPAHWQVCKLSFRYSVELGKMLDEKRNTGTNQVPYLRNQDVQWGVINIDDLPLIDIGPNELERYTVRLGDLLVCEGGDVGRAAIWRHRDGKIGYQKALHRLRPESPNRDTAEFFFYSLMAAKALGVFEESDTKATISHLPAEKFRQYKFAFPPIDDQQEIAAELGSRLKRSSETISYAENTIALLQERRSVLISAAVTGKIDVRNWQLASGSPSPELAQEAV
ncbi:restriction endonuclease subunit S [Pseudomonas ogarae]|uniref:restriction endonuclease subunit S n=1 Tax=Pseudomonas ogarae (strain DSM 112162 / CECT 30235 / F113) TaxID=1114970 RepID=UPI001F37A892